MNIYLDLFTAFNKIGVLTFGGGMSMLPMLRREVVAKHSWAGEEELLDWFALAQCMPGIIAVNVATFVGRHVKGFFGALAATLGIVFPSLVIIMILAAFISSFSDIAWVQSAFAGIRACVCVLVFNAVVRLVKLAVIDIYALLLFILVFAGATFLNLSPILFVLLSAAAGLVIQTLKGSKQA
ncbi:MAG: chromate transporter [Papillibacter sp.]|nr:chromate transporter [Papillibacter sp.]